MNPQNSRYSRYSNYSTPSRNRYPGRPSNRSTNLNSSFRNMSIRGSARTPNIRGSNIPRARGQPPSRYSPTRRSVPPQRYGSRGNNSRVPTLRRAPSRGSTNRMSQSSRIRNIHSREPSNIPPRNINRMPVNRTNPNNNIRNTPSPSIRSRQKSSVSRLNLPTMSSGKQNQNISISKKNEFSVSKTISMKKTLSKSELTKNKLEKQREKIKSLSGKWRSNIDSKTGRIYYYNRRHNVSTWEKPPQLIERENKKNKGKKNKKKSKYEKYGITTEIIKTMVATDTLYFLEIDYLNFLKNILNQQNYVKGVEIIYTSFINWCKKNNNPYANNLCKQIKLDMKNPEYILSINALGTGFNIKNKREGGEVSSKDSVSQSTSVQQSVSSKQISNETHVKPHTRTQTPPSFTKQGDLSQKTRSMRRNIPSRMNQGSFRSSPRDTPSSRRVAPSSRPVFRGENIRRASPSPMRSTISTEKIPPPHSPVIKKTEQTKVPPRFTVPTSSSPSDMINESRSVGPPKFESNTRRPPPLRRTQTPPPVPTGSIPPPVQRMSKVPPPPMPTMMSTPPPISETTEDAPLDERSNLLLEIQRGKNLKKSKTPKTNPLPPPEEGFSDILRDQLNTKRQFLATEDIEDSSSSDDSWDDSSS